MKSAQQLAGEIMDLCLQEPMDESIIRNAIAQKLAPHLAGTPATPDAAIEALAKEIDSKYAFFEQEEMQGDSICAGERFDIIEAIIRKHLTKGVI